MLENLEAEAMTAAKLLVTLFESGMSVLLCGWCQASPELGASMPLLFL